MQVKCYMQRVSNVVGIGRKGGAKSKQAPRARQRGTRATKDDRTHGQARASSSSRRARRRTEALDVLWPSAGGRAACLPKLAPASVIRPPAIGPCPPLGPQAQAGRPPPRAPRAESPWSAASPPHPPRPAPPRLRPSCCRPEPPAVARMAVQGADLGVAPPPGAAHNARQAQMVTPDPPVRPSPRSAVRSLRPPSLSALPWLRAPAFQPFSPPIWTFTTHWSRSC